MVCLDIVSTFWGYDGVCLVEGGCSTHLIKHRAPSKVYPSSHPVGRSMKEGEVDKNMWMQTGAKKNKKKQLQSCNNGSIKLLVRQKSKTIISSYFEWHFRLSCLSFSSKNVKDLLFSSFTTVRIFCFFLNTCEWVVKLSNLQLFSLSIILSIIFLINQLMVWSLK